MRWLQLALLSVFLTSPPLHATGINLLSEEHHIWGAAGKDGAGETLSVYALSDTRPVTHAVQGYYFDSPQELEVSESKASAGNWTLDVAAGRWAAYAFATSIYTFTPAQNLLDLTVSGYADSNIFFDYVSLALTDLDSGSELFSFNFHAYEAPSPAYYISTFTLSQSLSLQSNHSYQLILYAQATPADSPTFSGLTCSLSAQPSPVPELETALLFSLGLAVLAMMYRPLTP